MNKYFNVETLTTKTFWAGIGSIVAGAAMIYQGGALEEGLGLIVLGILAITGRDAGTTIEKSINK